MSTKIKAFELKKNCMHHKPTDDISKYAQKINILLNDVHKTDIRK